LFQNIYDVMADIDDGGETLDSSHEKLIVEISRIDRIPFPYWQRLYMRSFEPKKARAPYFACPTFQATRLSSRTLS
jgi:hypothetical protein